jgi:hypothetical protein
MKEFAVSVQFEPLTPTLSQYGVCKAFVWQGSLKGRLARNEFESFLFSVFL